MALTPEQIAEMDTVSGLTPNKFKEMDAIVNGTTDNNAFSDRQNKYAAIQNDNSLTREQKAERIKKIGEAERKGYEKDKLIGNLKDWGGFGLEVGSALINPAMGAKAVGTAIGKYAIPKAAQLLAKNAPGLLAGGAVYGLGENLIEDKRGLDAVKNVANNALINYGVGKGFEAVSKGVNNLLKRQATKEATAKYIEGLTSVPEEMGQLAIEKELAGESLLQGKFDSKTAYRPIEQQLRDAKNTLIAQNKPIETIKPIERKFNQALDMLPSNESFATEYKKLGDSALSGLERVEQEAGQQIQDVLGKIGQSEGIDINPLRNQIESHIDNYAMGGDYNAAIDKAGKDIAKVGDVLGAIDTPKKPIDLHNLKETLYDTANYETAGGIRNNALKGMANDINQYLRNKFPEYQAPNDKYSLIQEVKRGLDNESTLAGKIKELGTEGSILSGLDDRLKNLNAILPQENQFYFKAKDLAKEQNRINNIKNNVSKFAKSPRSLAKTTDAKTLSALKELEETTGINFMNDVEAWQFEQDKINDILKTLGNSYEKNPRLLGNRSDLKFEEALNELQSRTGANFMDDLQALRTREAFEAFAPGQGGGSGSEQGYLNFLRKALYENMPKPFNSITGALFFSPRFHGQNIVRGYANAVKASDKASQLYDLLMKGNVNAEINAMKELME